MAWSTCKRCRSNTRKLPTLFAPRSRRQTMRTIQPRLICLRKYRARWIWICGFWKRTCRRSGSLTLVLDFSADDGVVDLGCRDLILGNGENVLRKHSDVG